MVERAGEPNSEESVESGKQEARVIDAALFEKLTPDRRYTKESLEELFGIKFSDGLMNLLKEKSGWDGEQDGRFTFLGTTEYLENQTLKRRHEHDVENAVKGIPKNLKKVVINQTYLPQALAQIFDLRIEDGLLTHLKPYLSLRKLLNGNYKVSKFLSPNEGIEESELGYNPLVKDVYDALKTKFNDKRFMLRIIHIPPETREKMAPGLLPRIFEYLIDCGVLEEDEKKPKWYHIRDEFELKSK